MKIYATLAKIIGEIKNPTKNAINPHFKNRYATLDVICDDVREVCAKNGIAIVQLPTMTENGFVLRATAFASDETLALGDYPIKPVQDNPQGVGSAITYARRYQLCSILNIAAEDDDDGNTASAGSKAQTAQVLPPKPAPQAQKPIAKESDIKKEFDATSMRSALMVVLQGVSLEKEEQIAYAKKHWGIESLKSASDDVIADLYKRVCK